MFKLEEDSNLWSRCSKKGFVDKIGVSDENLVVCDENIGVSKQYLVVSNEKLGVSNEYLGLNNEQMGDSNEYLGVSDEKLGVYHKYHGVLNDKLGVSNENLDEIILWVSFKIWVPERSSLCTPMIIDFFSK